ncbi:hypothetical protein Tco_0584332 [Tanacetum coccineum]
MAEESSSGTMKKGKKVLVAETIEEEEDSQDTLDREINEYYDYEEDREATQDEMDEDKPPTPLIKDDFIPSSTPDSKYQHPPPSPANKEDTPSPTSKTTEAPTIQPPLL